MEESGEYSELKKSIYKVPEDYFETFDAKVLTRLQNEHRHLSIRHKVRFWQIAAGIFLVAGLSVFIYNQQTPEKVDLTNIEVSETDLNSFKEEVEVNDDEFMELLNKRSVDSVYKLEVLTVGYKTLDEESLEIMEEEYSPLEDEIEI